MIGQWVARVKVPVKALKFVGGVLKPLGPIGYGITTFVSTKQVINGEMSGGRYTFNMISTGVSIYARFVYRGPVGVLVGGVFYVGNMIYKDSERANEKLKKLNPTRANRKWYEFGKVWNFF